MLIVWRRLEHTGPHAAAATAFATHGGDGAFAVAVTIAGGTAPFDMLGTKHCTTCCEGSHPTGKTSDAHTLDCDVGGKTSGGTSALDSTSNSGWHSTLTLSANDNSHGNSNSNSNSNFYGNTDGGSGWVNTTGAVVNVATGLVTLLVALLFGLRPIMVQCAR
jgi:hypothetical protein